MTPQWNLRWIMAGAAALTLSAWSSLLMAAVPAPSRDRAAQVQQYFQRFPEADADGDGVLTEEEAQQHQRRRKQKSGRSDRSAAAEDALVPTRANVAYGPHPRNVLDFWRAPGEAATPVLVFYHGGSFKAGDKSLVLGRPILRECLQSGISVVSVNYRYSSDAPYPAPMLDGARAVQFLRMHAAEWGVDPARVAVSGSSAGATLALWIALHDDLADPSSGDPVSRQSTRVTCASPHSGTAGLTSDYFQRHAGVSRLGGALFQLFGVHTQAEFDSAPVRALAREGSPLSHVSSDDPPLLLTYAGEPAEAPFANDAPQSAWIHHVSLGLPLKARYEALRLECEVYHRGRPLPAGAELAFLRRHLRPAPR